MRGHRGLAGGVGGEPAGVEGPVRRGVHPPAGKPRRARGAAAHPARAYGA